MECTQKHPQQNRTKISLLTNPDISTFQPGLNSRKPEKAEEEGIQEGAKEDNIPQIWFSEAELNQFYTPWRKSLIAQTVNYKRSIPDIAERLPRIWKTKRPLTVTDIGQGFYVIKFDIPEEYFMALLDGPWFMFQYYLAVMQWKPNFRKSQYKGPIHRSPSGIF